MHESCDILVVGGGLVGASLAIALDAAGRRVCMVEAMPPRAAGTASYGERNLALSRASVNGLAALGVWPHALAQATAIRHIHISRAGDFGALRLHATQHGVDAFGHTLPARELGAALQQRLADCRHVRRLAPATLVGVQPRDGGWRARIERVDMASIDIDTALLVGADGSHSFVRQALGIGADTFDYEQTLFVATVTPQRAPNGRAFERFSDAGPVALLPLAGDRAGLVLTVAGAEAEAVGALDDDAFIALAQRRFGARLGRLTRPGKRHPHAAMRVAAHALTARRAVLVGNAAQTVHPIGAQGFNLGLRDALTLAELAAQGDPGDAALLAEYRARRAPDRDGVMAFSHGLVRLACAPQAALSPLRSLAMLTLNGVPALRHGVARRGMGFRDQPPRAILERLP